ncbi:FtsX-like permease family protein [Bacillus piscicola]|uniref:FtsX-like permease family protein n=1 Tax=Bacillus piscicola TaxID=1632684 RepID=UPI001F095AF4|nr:FtsX-like permease family protein [Bacillus piscicola]
MNINQIIYRNLKKNIKNYYVYIFALVFSVALYFAFVTLQYDPALDTTKGTVRGAAALKASSIMLIVIVAVFLLYANNLFIKRRSKEIGLFQLVGMTKSAIFRVLSVENVMLYVGSLLIGIFLGFSVSRLLMLILFKVTGVNDVATLSFSVESLIQTLVVFSAIYLLIMLMNYIFIKRQSILALFHVPSTAEQRVKKMTPLQALVGILGIGLIVFGYYLSSRLFSSEFFGNQLFIVMLMILASVILGTYLFYKGSVSFIFNIIRKQKGGYLNVNDVLSLSSIMFRMRSNSFLLTVITTLSALAIGLLSLSYISYYSAEKTAMDNIPDHFSIPTPDDASEAPPAEKFMNALDEANIDYTTRHVDLIDARVDLWDIISIPDEAGGGEPAFDAGDTTMTVISDDDVGDLDVAQTDVFFANRDKAMEKIFPFKDQGQITLSGEKTSFDLKYQGFKDISAIPTRLTGGFPVAVVDQSIFKKVVTDKDPDVRQEFTAYKGVNIRNTSNVEEADVIFRDLGFNEWAGYESRYAKTLNQKMSVGLTMFIVGFLGLAFLITSGCILYFKQMDESEDERPNYTILWKLGFTESDLLKGIRRKQLFNFGIPLVVGLIHSYFAVKSGWFFFGTEMVIPMAIVMLIYTGLYSIFGMLSVLYYKRMIRMR